MCCFRFGQIMSQGYLKLHKNKPEPIQYIDYENDLLKNVTNYKLGYSMNNETNAPLNKLGVREELDV